MIDFGPELFTNQSFTVNTGRHKKLSFAAVFSYKQNNQQFICQRQKRVNNAGGKPVKSHILKTAVRKISTFMCLKTWFSDFLRVHQF
jgi:hypothetical protein